MGFRPSKGGRNPTDAVDHNGGRRRSALQGVRVGAVLAAGGRASVDTIQRDRRWRSSLQVRHPLDNSTGIGVNSVVAAIPSCRIPSPREQPMWACLR